MSIEAELRRAKSHSKRSEYGAACRVYQTILDRYPNNKRAQDGLGQIRQLLPPAPPPEVLTHLRALHQSGDHATLVHDAGELLALYPEDPTTLDLASTANIALGRHEDALHLLQSLIDAQPGNADAHGKLGTVYLKLGELDRAAQSFKAALRIAPSAAANNNLGQVAVAKGDLQSAKTHFEKAAKDSFAPALNNLGNILRAEGDATGAREAFERSLAQSESAAAHWNLASLKTFTPDDPQIARMEVLAKDAPDEDRMLLCFGLGRAFQHLDQRDAAFEWFAEGNRLRKHQLGYTIAQDRKLFARTKSAFAGPFPPLGAPDGPTPIFIVGMPRSGTTLVEQILSCHHQIAAGGEVPLLNERMAEMDWSSAAPLAGLGELQSDYADHLRQIAKGHAYVTDKMPLNFRWVGAIRALFPSAKIIDVRRDPRATCWSNFTHFYSEPGNGFAYDLDDLAAYYGLYQDLMTFWSASYPHVTLNYDRLAASPETEIPALLKSLGLPNDEACLRPEDNDRMVATSSSLQVRRKIYSGASEAWKSYEDFLSEAFADLRR